MARALANDPPIIIADEPTGNLDSKVGQEIMDLLLSLNRERGTTLIIVTHDPKISEQTERVIRLMDGHLEGTTELAQPAKGEKPEKREQAEVREDAQKGGES